jgi:hypothetical protein
VLETQVSSIASIQDARGSAANNIALRAEKVQEGETEHSEQKGSTCKLLKISKIVCHLLLMETIIYSKTTHNIMRGRLLFA